MFLKVKKSGSRRSINHLIKIYSNIIKLSALNKPIKGKILEILVIGTELFFKTIGLSNKQTIISVFLGVKGPVLRGNLDCISLCIH